MPFLVFYVILLLLVSLMLAVVVIAKEGGKPTDLSGNRALKLRQFGMVRHERPRTVEGAGLAAR